MKKQNLLTTLHFSIMFGLGFIVGMIVAGIVLI